MSAVSGFFFLFIYFFLPIRLVYPVLFENQEGIVCSPYWPYCRKRKKQNMQLDQTCIVIAIVIVLQQGLGVSHQWACEHDCQTEKVKISGDGWGGDVSGGPAQISVCHRHHHGQASLPPG